MLTKRKVKLAIEHNHYIALRDLISGEIARLYFREKEITDIEHKQRINDQMVYLTMLGTVLKDAVIGK